VLTVEGDNSSNSMSSLRYMEMKSAIFEIVLTFRGFATIDSCCKVFSRPTFVRACLSIFGVTFATIDSPGLLLS
jgi:vancomycin permeability regulator SanA